MTVARLVVGGAAFLATAVFVLLSSGLPPSQSELARRSGCSDATAISEMRGFDVFMMLRAGECLDAAGRPLSSSASVDQLAGTAWKSLRTPVDAFVVTVVGNAGGPATAVVERDVLRQRFGPGPPGAVLPVVEHGVMDLIWLLLPVGYVAFGVVLLLIARRCGIVLIWFRH